MVFAPASALHSWRSSVCSFVVPPHSHPGAILHFVRHLRGQPGLILLLWPPLALRPNTKALRRSGGAFATPVFIAGKSYKETAWLPAPPPRLAWRRNGAARLVRSSLRSSLPRLRPPGHTRTKNRGGITAVAAAQISIKGKPTTGGFDLQKKANDYGYKTDLLVAKNFP